MERQVSLRTILLVVASFFAGDFNLDSILAILQAVA